MLHEIFIAPLAEFTFMRYALGVAVIVGVCSAVLSCLLVVRRQALLGDAISHAVLLGVVLGWMSGQRFGIFWGALIAGVAAGVAITFIERNSRIKLDAAMGILFTFMFALGLLIIGVVKPTGIDLFHVLFGTILGITFEDLMLTAASGGLVVAFIAVFFRGFHLWSFDPAMARAAGLPTGLLHYLFTALLSAAIVASLQSVGLILVIAMLVTPGATAYLLSDRLGRMMCIAVALGVFSAAAGIYGSYHFNLASGPAIVVVVSLCFLVVFLFAPRRGLVARLLRGRWAAAARLDDDVLRCAVMAELEEGHPLDADGIGKTLGRAPHEVERRVRSLARRGLVQKVAGRVHATPRGRETGAGLVRKHRLLESYLYDKEGVSLDQLHREADRMEHTVTGDFLDILDRQLGNPAVDPHGHSIPGAAGEERGLRRITGHSLWRLPAGGSGRVSLVRDDRDDLLREMLRLNIAPDTLVTALAKHGAQVKVRIEGSETTIPEELAERIYVIPAAASR